MRHCLLQFLVLTVPFLASLTTQAGPKDLKIFQALSRAGVKSMRQVAQQMRVSDIQCTSSMMTQKAYCTMTDRSHSGAKNSGARSGAKNSGARSGAKNSGARSEAKNSGARHGVLLTVSGKAAKSIFQILVTSGAHGDSGAGRAMIAVKSIHCTQQAPQADDDSPADRTSCMVDIGTP